MRCLVGLVIGLKLAVDPLPICCVANDAGDGTCSTATTSTQRRRCGARAGRIARGLDLEGEDGHPFARTPSAISSLVEPDVVEPPVVIDAVHLANVAFDVGVTALGGVAVVDDRSSHVIDENALDPPDDLLPLGDVALG